MDFAALHIRTGYSFLQSGVTLKKAFAIAIKNKYYGFGLTDVNSLTGYPELQHLVKSSNVKPAFGVDIPYQDDVLSLYVIEEEGYKNLITLSYQASIEPISAEFLRNHSDGLALILDVSHSKLIELQDDEQIRDYLSNYERLFPIFDLGLPFGDSYTELNQKVRDIVKKYPYSLVAFPHMLYEKKEDAIVLEIVNAIKDGTTLSSKKSIGDNYFVSIEEISAFYQEGEITETVNFVNSLKFNFSQKRGKLLKAIIPEGTNSTDYLKDLSFEGLKKKLNLNEIPSNYVERLNYELSVISSMGYSDYFLIVLDYINWARENGIYVGPGRGSGGGSLVAYALDIIHADPIKYDLLFERFLNPQRQSMPDLDVDFSDYRRNELPIYLSRHYGEERVGHIVTMQTLAAKGAIRDIGRVFDIPQRDIDILCKAVIDPKKNLRENYKISKNLKELVDSEPQYLEIVALASKIESLPRQSGVHPAGVVLNDEALINSVPVKNDPELGLVVQYEHDYLEEQGFLKMDLLALRNLSIIETCIKLVKRNHNIDLDYQQIPYDDPKAIETIRKLNVMGLFQLESAGMKNANRKLNPTCFEDIVALISLFRPGPMEEIATYSKRKAGLEKITYLTPQIEPILKNTYGIIVYQEQIMMIAQVMAGFSYGEADLLRRAISKKDSSKLDNLKVKFINGCINKGNTKDIAIKTYELIYKFANYGFNKSHALCYAIIACQMSYLKTYYPNEFYTAILNFSSAVGDSSFVKIIAEMKNIGLKLANPSVNESELGYSIKDNKVLLPLVSIKGVQFDFAKNLFLERNEAGNFENFFDFVIRMKKYGLTQPLLVSIIDSGALDSIDSRRTSLRLAAFDAINYAEMLYGENGNRIQLDFQIPLPVIKEVPEIADQNLTAEKEAIGMMLSSSPLAKYRELSQYKNLKTIADLDDSDGFVTILAMVGNPKVVSTKKGTSMVFVDLYDEDSTKEFIAFQRVYDESFRLFKKDKNVLAVVRKDLVRPDTFIIEKLEEIKVGE